MPGLKPLGDDVFDNTAAFRAGETHVQTLILHRQLGGIHAEQMQHRGMEIVDADGILHCRVAQVIRCAVSKPLLNAAAGEQEGEALDMVIAPAAAL